MTDIGPKLRDLIIRGRKDSVRWAKQGGLSQKELAKKAGTSQVWLRQIETGYTDTASPQTLGNILYALGIPTRVVRELGKIDDVPGNYDDVADSMDAYVVFRYNVLPGSTEAHLLDTPGLTAEEKDLLVDTLRESRRTEPLGRDMWRTRRRRV